MQHILEFLGYLSSIFPFFSPKIDALKYSGEWFFHNFTIFITYFTELKGLRIKR